MRLPLLTTFLALTSAFAQIPTPVPQDSNLEVTLIAAEPQIVTPIGIAVDKRHRLFVVESHTHHRPDNYTGPATDLVKVFLDNNKDGIPETPKVFAEGFKSAMNLALSPKDELYLVHRAGVVILHDADGDGVSERSTQVIKLITTEEYPHNGLSGITFSADGWMYLGIGENFGAEYTLQGTDGSSVKTGPGRGGKVFRCRPDGAQVEQVAAGFWNPFGLELDGANRLFCVDNDPGGRPPCRLLHVVTGGDYGYKRRYDDTNVFNGWDGELPGTLPMVTGTGESPCGILSCDRLALPASFAGALLVASWGDAAIELYRLQPHGASFRATKETFLAGERKFNEAFCPVDMAPAPDGSLYITDWADRTSYPVHGKGRIWRLSAKAGVQTSPPTDRTTLTKGVANKSELRFHRLLKAGAEASAELTAALADSDPFIRSAAITALTTPAARDTLAAAVKNAEPEVRLNALIAQWRSLPADVTSTDPAADRITLLRGALADPDERIRFLALWWAGEDAITELKDELRQTVAQKPTPLLFQAYLTAAELLAAATDPAPAAQTKAPIAKTAPAVRQRLLAEILHDDTQPAALHAMAAASVTALDDAKTAARLIHFARTGDPALRREAVRTLGACPAPEVPETLKALALDIQLPAPLRADAIVALARRDLTLLPHLTPLLSDSEPTVQVETARALRMIAHEPMVRTALQNALVTLTDPASPLAQQLHLALPSAQAKAKANAKTKATPRPTTPAEWRATLAATAAAPAGDPASGERLFQHPLTNCIACHKAQGRGVTLGPDLSNVARSLDRSRLIDAILDPSREVAPQYEHHLVTTKTGVIYSGVLIHSALDGAPLMDALGAGRLRIPMAQVERHDTSPLSLMPPGLQDLMTLQDFQDLLTYLQTLK